MTDTLLQLADRCERATGPDRELDALIWCALNGFTEITYPTDAPSARIEAKNASGEWRLIGWVDPGKTQRNFSPYGGNDAYPDYTASIDAAMTLVPEGMEVSLGNEPIEWWAHVGPRDDPNSDETAYTGSTPALALCVAALRARAASKGPKP